MLAYAAHRRSHRRLSPSTLLLIGAGHALAIGLAITAKMTFDPPAPPTRTRIVDIPLDPPPEPAKPEPQVQQDPRVPPPPVSRIDTPPPVVLTPPIGVTVPAGPSIITDAPDIGVALGNTLPPPTVLLPPAPPAAVVRIGPRAATPSDLLRPPYPESKQRTEEEALLRLRLTIDARGRVTAVEPIGTADPAFLTAARSHLTRHWRYRPATEDGRAVASTLTITLRFELEE